MSSGESTAPATVEEWDGPLLTVGGSSFPTVDHVAEWNLMRLAAKMEDPDEMVGLAAMYRFVLSIVRPEYRDALDEHLGTLDLARSDLDNAIGDALVEMAGRGKRSGPPTATRPSGASSGSSSDGSPETAPTRRVVSLSRGTSREEPIEAETGSSTG